MKRFHLLFRLNSLAVVLVSLERFSFTTRVLLQPSQFLRLHEALQIGVLILATVLIPLGEQQRDIISAFGLYVQCFFHVFQLTRILKWRPDLSER